MLAASLRDVNTLVGTFTSPHLVRYNERIAIDGVAADDAAIIAAFEWLEAVRADTPLTYFEASTLAALRVFEQANVDAVILEVGLGGRLDAVNAVHADAMLITSIDLDHKDWLGDTRELIGLEKAGILRPNRPAVFAGLDMPDSIDTYAAANDVPLWVAGRDYQLDVASSGKWRYRSAAVELVDLPPLGLAGRHQLSNAAGVIALLQRLQRLPSDIGQRLAALTVTGRFHEVGRDPTWVLDVAHNPAAAEALAAALTSRPVPGKTRALVGLLATKDLDGTIHAVAPAIDEWYAVGGESAASVPALTLASRIAAATTSPCGWFDTVAEAVEVLQRDACSGERVVVFGSFTVVGPALRALGL